MGFGAARHAARPSMLTGFLGPGAEAAAARDAGADFIVVDARARDLSAADAKTARGAAGDLPLGVWGKATGGDAAKEFAEAGVDFLLFDPDSTPAAALLVEKLGYVLALPDAPEELFLRSLEALTLDAVLLDSVPSPLTVSRQIELHRVGMLARKPILCQVQPDAAQTDLECLRAAGVVGLIVAGAVAGVTRLKETVAALPARRQRREERPVVALPRGNTHDEEDDDDE
jgi:hypothetical protein